MDTLGRMCIFSIAGKKKVSNKNADIFVFHILCLNDHNNAIHDRSAVNIHMAANINVPPGSSKVDNKL